MGGAVETPKRCNQDTLPILAKRKREVVLRPLFADWLGRLVSAEAAERHSNIDFANDPRGYRAMNKPSQLRQRLRGMHCGGHAVTGAIPDVLPSNCLCVFACG